MEGGSAFNGSCRLDKNLKNTGLLGNRSPVFV
jgi:hypothetical protein